MTYTIYQTTNLINGKIYIGVHATENPDVFDGYLGSGKIHGWKTKLAERWNIHMSGVSKFMNKYAQDLV